MSIFGPPNIDKLRKKKNINGLIKALDHKYPRIYSGAESALVDIGSDAVIPLIDALNTDNFESQRTL